MPFFEGHHMMATLAAGYLASSFLTHAAMPGLTCAASVTFLMIVWLSVKNQKKSEERGALDLALATASSKPVSLAW